MEYYIGLDISQRQTAICIVDDKGVRVKEGKALTEPSDIYTWIAKHVDAKLIMKVGLEAGAMSAWLYTELSKLGLPMLCMEAFQAPEFLKAQRNKTDKNDARGLAQMVRMGGEFIRPVTVRSQSSQEARALLTMRQFLVKQKVDLENNITGTLKPFGLVTPRGNMSAKTFQERVYAILDRADERSILVRGSVIPSLDLYDTLCKQLGVLTKKVEVMAKADPVCRLLMTAPGVGPIVSLSFVTAVENPKRFADPGDIGAYFGLTPKQYQSGETDRWALRVAQGRGDIEPLRLIRDAMKKQDAQREKERLELERQQNPLLTGTGLTFAEFRPENIDALLREATEEQMRFPTRAGAPRREYTPLPQL